MKMERPKVPLLFFKAPSALIGDGGEIVYPSQTKELHYEAELAIVIRDRTKNISSKEALQHIAGFTCSNDVSARDLQLQDGQWARAKSFDTFCPVGPKVVSGIDPNNLAIKCYLNGELKQSSNTGNMVFKVEELVSFISSVMTLEQNDIILTGTPPGIGPMRVGDVVEVEIEKIGRLKNRVVAA
ncbi:MAG: fumarylacetoacetate hydrolase family protein [Candidatus Margulisbacteria bacterium]|nr:fumarylacetoacetate hydrolase family protein [Candidatus Margulisiibacteriota bacterium]MBU1617331.1 fumarylacetoacetate hydrolase family protein [Candidatus Margulisiibacteriota bacterium]